MKLYYLSNSLIPSRTANSIHVMQMCQAFAQLGHDVTLFAGHGNKGVADAFAFYGIAQCFEMVQFPRPNVPVIRSVIYGPCVARRVRRMDTPDLLYARDPISLWLTRRTCCPLVYEAHFGTSESSHFLEQQLFRRTNFSHLVVISSALKMAYCTVYPNAGFAKKIVVAHDAASDFGNTHPATLGGRTNTLQIGYVGHLYAGKGIDLILQLARNLPQHDFHIIGGTEREIRALRNRKKQTKNLLIHGFVPPAVVGSNLAVMDVLLAPYQTFVAAAGGGRDISRWMSPLKIFEYMSASKAIVASDLPVLREVLEHDVNCLLAKHDSVEEWSNMMEKLVDHRLRERLGNRARSDYQQNYTWRARAERVLAGL